MTEQLQSEIFVENPKVIEAIRASSKSDNDIKAVLSFAEAGKITYREHDKLFIIRDFDQDRKSQSIVPIAHDVKGTATTGDYLIRTASGFLYAAPVSYVENKFVAVSKLTDGNNGIVDTTFSTRRRLRRGQGQVF